MPDPLYLLLLLFPTPELPPSQPILTLSDSYCCILTTLICRPLGILLKPLLIFSIFHNVLVLLAHSSLDLALSSTYSIPFHLFYVCLSHHHSFSLYIVTHTYQLSSLLACLQYSLDNPMLCILIVIYP